MYFITFVCKTDTFPYFDGVSSLFPASFFYSKNKTSKNGNIHSITCTISTHCSRISIPRTSLSVYNSDNSARKTRIKHQRHQKIHIRSTLPNPHPISTTVTCGPSEVNLTLGKIVDQSISSGVSGLQTITHIQH